MAKKKRGRGPSQAAIETVASNPDTLYEILLRLPADSMLKFKRVSRQWYDLISNPQFCIDHARRNPNPRPAGLFLNHRPPYLRDSLLTGDVKFARFDKDYRARNCSRLPCEFPKGVRIRDSCNGLLLCSSGQAWWESWKPNAKLYVCNPTTKRTARIPNSVPRANEHSSCYTLVFDPSTAEKYRVVCLWRCRDSYRADVYESETGSWRSSAAFSTNRFSLHYTAVWNCVIHWIGWDGSLFCLDFNKDCFRKLPVLLPCQERNMKYFGACQGHLYMVSLDQNYNPNSGSVRLVVYEMEQDYSCWSVKYSIVDHSVLGPRFDLCYICSTILEEEELILLISYRNGIFSWKASGMNSNVLLVRTNFSRNLRRCAIHNFIQSLAPV